MNKLLVRTENNELLGAAEPCEKEMSVKGNVTIYEGQRIKDTVAVKVIEENKSVKGGFVSIEVYRQIMWERDIAISYLERAGVSLGENVDVVRTDVVEDVIKKRKSIYQGGLNYDAGYRQACDDIYLGIMDRTGGGQK